MGKFNGKISAEFTPPRTWILEKSLSFETEHLNNDDIEILTQVGAKVEDTGKGTGKVTCGKGMKTDLALFLEQFGHLSHLGMLQEQL